VCFCHSRAGRNSRCDISADERNAAVSDRTRLPVRHAEKLRACRRDCHSLRNRSHGRMRPEAGPCCTARSVGIAKSPDLSGWIRIAEHWASRAVYPVAGIPRRPSAIAGASRKWSSTPQFARRISSSLNCRTDLAALFSSGLPSRFVTMYAALSIKRGVQFCPGESRPIAVLAFDHHVVRSRGRVNLFGGPSVFSAKIGSRWSSRPVRR
jgi:hypothetical protein